MATRGKPVGLPKSGGRVKKSLDRQQRVLISGELAHSILATFELLGGTAAMFEWAAENQTVFYTQILSRLMPAPQRDDPAIEVNTQVNIGDANLTERQAAVRVAFALAKATYQLQDEEPAIDITPRQACDWRDPVGVREPDPPPLLRPEPEPIGPDKQRWVEELPLTDEQRRDNALVRETLECTLENYRGGPGEQGGSVSRSSPTAVTKRSAGELARSMSRRGRDLL
ncbi:hypothetical protein [Pseudomonas sp. VI4.1]|uniref:hypothetical protein n=1 Tax=Pseudomonas sp. VI4.1 TaxID=1941346 RepID=UPI0009D20D7C|nr:hypothetical protein [Pseudomonas sp. VI4.1]OPK06790.1 hypothetical protein BZ163_29750 [Pseudomonas sp. VI4.1]